MTEESSQNQVDEGQPLIEHLIELRSRILKSLACVVIIFIPLFYYANPIYAYISEPLRVYLPKGTTMIATQVASPFLAPFKLSMVLAVFIAIPYILHQIWSFISPGLYTSERKIALPLLFSSVVLFYCGVAFSFYVVFPMIFGFFTKVAPTGVKVMTDINSYLDFVLKLFFAFGVVFEIPIATVLLVWSGITTVDALKRKRPYIVVGCFVVGMLLTPPDVFSQIMLAMPMWALWEIGIFFASWVKREPAEEESA